MRACCALAHRAYVLRNVRTRGLAVRAPHPAASPDRVGFLSRGSGRVGVVGACCGVGGRGLEVLTVQQRAQERVVAHAVRPGERALERGLERRARRRGIANTAVQLRREHALHAQALRHADAQLRHDKISDARRPSKATRPGAAPPRPARRRRAHAPRSRAGAAPPSTRPRRSARAPRTSAPSRCACTSASRTASTSARPALSRWSPPRAPAAPCGRRLRAAATRAPPPLPPPRSRSCARHGARRAASGGSPRTRPRPRGRAPPAPPASPV